MQLRSIRLRNIRSYTDHEMRFADGTTLLAGDIGAGKSSVLLAVEFALFGIVRGQLDGKSLLRHGRDTGSVELSFDVDGTGVVLHRALRRVKDDVRASAGHVEINGRRIVGTPIELKSRVLEILGYPKDALTKTKSLIYRYTVYTPQEHMRAILTEDAAARQETIRKVFGVDRYKRAAENAATAARAMRESRNLALARAEGLEQDTKRRGEIEAQRTELQAKLAACGGRVSELQKSLGDAKQQLAGLEETREKLTALLAQRSALDAKVAEKEARVRVLSQELQRVADAIAAIQKEPGESAQAPAPQPLERLEQRLEALQADYHALVSAKAARGQQAKMLASQRTALEADVRAQEQKVLSLEARREFFEKSRKETDGLAGLAAAIEDLRTQSTATVLAIREHQLMHEQANGLIEQLAHADTCPVCRQKLEARHKKAVISEAQQQAAKAHDGIRQHNHHKEKLAAELARAQQDQQRLQKLHESLQAIRGEIAQLGELRAGVASKSESLRKIQEQEKELAAELSDITGRQLDGVEAQIRSTRELIARVREQQQAAQRRAHMEERQKELGEQRRRMEDEQAQAAREIAVAKETRNGLAAEIAASRGIAAEYAKLTSHIDGLHRQESEARAQQAGLAAQDGACADDLTALAQRIAAKEQERAEADRIAAVVQWLSAVVIPTLSLMEQHVLARAHAEFNAYFSGWFSMLMDDETISARIDDTFSAIVEQDGYETQVQNLSGGEKTSCALAYRLALNRVINDLIPAIRTKDLLILDEPTEGFSSEQLDRVRDVLRELSLRQVLIVSHEQKIESFVDHVIRVHKSQHRSQVL